MPRDFTQHAWSADVADDCRQLVRLAIREDLDRWHDWTTVALVPADATSRAAVVARQELVVAGMPAAALVLDEMDRRLTWEPHAIDGVRVTRGTTLAVMSGPARSLLTAERTVLNLLGRLCGVASVTAEYVAQVQGTKARIYDTRKTTPGWRRLEKYAVRCGGGHNHRTGLFDAILIKDNHLAFGAAAGARSFTPAQAVAHARQFVREYAAAAPARTPRDVTQPDFAAMLVEVEVDTLEQLEQVLPAGPDIVLLDNMSPEELRAAVARRDAVAPGVELEASGGVNLATVRTIAQTGVDRISAGALTHSVASRDVALDWLR